MRGKRVLLFMAILLILIVAATGCMAESDSEKGNESEKPSDNTTSSPIFTDEPESEPLIPDTTSSPTNVVSGGDEFANQLLKDIDIDLLKAQDSGVFGMIAIPELTSSIVYEGVGSVHIDNRCNVDFSDYNTIIYVDEDMLSDILLYREQSFYNDCPSVYVLFDGGVQRYDIFSVYLSEAENDAAYTVSFENDEKKAEFVNTCKNRSEIFCDDAKKGANILTLSVADPGQGARLVIQGYLAHSVSMT